MSPLSPTRVVGRGAARRSAALFAALLVWSAGCQSGGARPEQILPQGGIADPWLLEAPAWVGPFDEARSALGDDVAGWKSLGPHTVWLARYRHVGAPARSLTVRAFLFEDPQAAERALADRCDGDTALTLADGGCWTTDGMLFRTQRTLFELFAFDGRQPLPAEQTALIGTHVEQRVARLGVSP